MSGKLRAVGSFLFSWIAGHILDALFLGVLAGVGFFLFTRLQELLTMIEEHPVAVAMLALLAALLGALAGYGFKNWRLNKSARARSKAVLRDMLEAPYEVREVLLSFYRGGGRVRAYALDERIEYLRRRGLIELPTRAFEGNALIFMPANVMSVLGRHATEILGDLEGFDGEEGEDETGGSE